MKNKVFAILFLLMLFVLSACSVDEDVYANNGRVNEALGSQSTLAKTVSSDVETYPSAVQVNRVSDTSLALTWNKILDVKGYEIYRYDADKKKYIKAKAVKNPRTKWTDKNLKRNKIYKYKLRSYFTSTNKKSYGKFSYVVSAKTYTKDARIVNAGKVNSKSSITLAIREKKKINAKVLPSKLFSNVQKKTVIDKKIRWILNANSLLKINKQKGYIEGTKEGRVNLYAVAHNGKLKKIKVNVVDYTKPKIWDFEKPDYVFPIYQDRFLDEIPSEVKELLLKQRDDMTKIASYFDKNHKKLGALEYPKPKFSSEKGPLMNEMNLYLDDDMQETVTRFMKDCPNSIHIQITEYEVTFNMSFDYITSDAQAEISYRYIEDKSDYTIDDVLLAPRWTFRLFLPEMGYM